MKPLQRVFSKQATAHGASMVALERCYILIKPNNTHIRNCHIYPVQKCDSWFWSKSMKPLQRVFSKQATPLLASMVSLERCYILIKPNTLLFGIVTFILYKRVIQDFGPKLWNLCRECSRNRKLHFWRAWCRWSGGISTLNQITLIFEIVTFIL